MKTIKYCIISIVLLVLFMIQTYGQTNTKYGQDAGNAGSNNTTLGYLAGDTVTGSSNTFVGARSGSYVSTGYENTFLGTYSGNNNATGYRNTFIGFLNGTYNIGGANNVFLGNKAGYLGTASSSNVSIGLEAGYTTNGNNNVFVGMQTGKLNTGAYNVFIGSLAGYNETGSNKLYIDNSNTSSPLIYGDFSSNLITINGKQGIGTTNVPDSIKLKVNGTIMAKKVLIITTGFPDFVFKPDYKLMPLNKLNEYISLNHHLPGIPEEKKVIETGIDIAEMNKLLVQKVEELTLYVIKLNNEIVSLKLGLSNQSKE